MHASPDLSQAQRKSIVRFLGGISGNGGSSAPGMAASDDIVDRIRAL